MLYPIAGDQTGMKTGAAGEYQYGIHIGEYFGCAGAKEIGREYLRTTDHLQRRRQHFRLLENFLLHEMGVVAFVDLSRGQGADVYRAVDTDCQRRTVSTNCANSAERNFRYITLFKVDDIAGDRQQRRGVRRGVIARLAQAQQQGRAMP